MENLTLIIPTKEESDSLPVLLNELKSYNCKIIIVLENKDTKTISAITDYKNIDIHFQKNKGYGNALIEGINKTTSEYFCIINADGSMNPKYLNTMLNECKYIDFVFASRYSKDGGSDDDNFVTFIGNKIFTLLGNIFFKLNLPDILFTYVLGKTQSAKNLQLQYNDFRICVEIPIKAKSKKLSFTSVPSKERKRIAGKKKVNAFKDGLLILLAMMTLFFKKCKK